MHKKRIAWGNSKLLKMYLSQVKQNPFDYCIDDFTKEIETSGMPIIKSGSIEKEKPNTFQIVIFAVSSRSLQEISLKLNRMGLGYGADYIFYSDLFYDDFVSKVRSSLGFELDPRIYSFALSYTLNSRVLIHTTLLGTWLFLEMLKKLDNVAGQIAEVGAFQGGNSLCSLNFMATLKPKMVYILDSFDGFPELSKNDPNKFSKGDYKIETSFQEIRDSFSFFPNSRVIKGFVPATFKELRKSEKFSLVFYDCDLYEPALDTFDFFWDRIVPGGYLLVHDYQVEEGGFTGVKKATDEFFAPKDVAVHSFFENTMAVIKK